MLERQPLSKKNLVRDQDPAHSLGDDSRRHTVSARLGAVG
jgi:hypothetical protein